MEFEERKRIINFLTLIENTYSVHEWEYKGISLWPILKSESFFINYVKSKPERTSKFILLQKKCKRIILFIWDCILTYINIKYSKKSKINNFFLSELHFRVLWDHKSFNKYFDPMMDYIEKESSEKSVLLEMSKMNNKTSFYKRERLINTLSYYSFFKLKHKKGTVSFKSFQDFDIVVEKISENIGVSINEIKVRIENHLNQVLIWEKIAGYLLDKMEPKNVFMLCYYTLPSFGFILAAKKRGITTIDMQHGGQGEFHPFYNFANIPTEGFSVLPTIFWNWDRSSFNTLNETFSKTKRHRALIGGNIWGDYLKNVKFDLKTNKKIILYTMQTDSVPVLHDYIIDAIKKSSEDYLWWLRLHPRMTKLEVDELLSTVENKEIKNKVRIDYGKEDPLPLILMNCYAHVSHFSGCILEAALLKVTINVVIGEIGMKFYKELIDNEKASYFNPYVNKNLFTEIEYLTDRNRKTTLEDVLLVDYKKIIKEKFIANERV